MRYRITFAFQLWWYFNKEVELWFPFHEFYFRSYDRYALKIERVLIDPTKFVKFKLDGTWYHYLSNKGVAVLSPKPQFTEPPLSLQ